MQTFELRATCPLSVLRASGYLSASTTDHMPNSTWSTLGETASSSSILSWTVSHFCTPRSLNDMNQKARTSLLWDIFLKRPFLIWMELLIEMATFHDQQLPASALLCHSNITEFSGSFPSLVEHFKSSAALQIKQVKYKVLCTED